MKRNKFGDFIVTKVEIKDEIVETVDDLEGTSSEEEVEEEEVKEEAEVETKKVVVKEISKKQ